MEKLAGALEIELYQLFSLGERKPEVPQVAARTSPWLLGPDKQALLKLFSRMAKRNRSLLQEMARKMAATGRPASVTRAKE